MIRPELIALYQEAKRDAWGGTVMYALLDEIVILVGELLRREHDEQCQDERCNLGCDESSIEYWQAEARRILEGE